MIDYFIIEKEKSEFQKLLNQWKHIYDFSIMFMEYDSVNNVYRALIKRRSKCPHGTLGGREKCMKCKGMIP